MIKGASCKYTNQLSKKEIANTELIASDISHPDCEMMTIKIAKFCNRRPQKSDQKYLSRAENLLTANIRLNPVNLNPEIIRLLIVTLINWSEIHINKENSINSIYYLTQAIKTSDKWFANNPKLIYLRARCRINMAKIFLMSNKPEKSKEYSEQALAIILKEITENKFDSKFVKKIASVGVIAFYYIGVCEETKKNVNDMLIAYENAVRLGEKYLSKEDEILKLSKKAMSDLTNGNLITQETNDQSNLDAQELTVLSNPPSHNHTLMISSSHTSPPIIHAYDSLSKSITRPSIKRAKIPPPQHIDEKLPGRYYSQRQLQKITEHLSQEKSIKVISADNHFYNKISKSLNLSKNTLKKVNSVKDINKSHREEKGVIYRLRKRKAPHKQYKNIQNISSFEKTLERLNSEDEIRLRKQEAILSSKMNTKIYKQMLQSLNLPLGSKVRKPPKPRLKFVPLYDSLNRSFEDSEIEITVKGNSYEKANTEIGDLMVIIENSLKIPKKSPKIMRNYTEIGDLAKSAWNTKEPTSKILPIKMSKIFRGLIKRKSLYMSTKVK